MTTWCDRAGGDPLLRQCVECPVTKSNCPYRRREHHHLAGAWCGGAVCLCAAIQSPIQNRTVFLRILRCFSTYGTAGTVAAAERRRSTTVRTDTCELDRVHKVSNQSLGISHSDAVCSHRRSLDHSRISEPSIDRPAAAAAHLRYVTRHYELLAASAHTPQY